jgi:hypothetical protein
VLIGGLVSQTAAPPRVRPAEAAGESSPARYNPSGHAVGVIRGHFYVLGRVLRTREKYITAKAASSTPPTIKIKVVTIAHSHRLDEPTRNHLQWGTASHATCEARVAASGCQQ